MQTTTNKPKLVATPVSTESVEQKKHVFNWGTIIALVFLHIGAVAAFWFITWQALALAFLFNFIGLSWGIGMGYHRLLTHRSYKVPKVIERFLAVCATLALEGGPIFWVGTHRIHHQCSDQPGDPHSPRDGAWWSHMGWIILGESKHSEVDYFRRYAPDLTRDPFYCWLNKYHWLPLTILGALLLAFGGVSVFLWAGAFRVVWGLHWTWAVNSATHMWGSRRFKTKDDSRNNWWVALMSFGEGWHNNHHGKPNSARHGLAWYELDITWLQINLLKSLGIASGVKVAKVSDAVDPEEAPAAAA
jgi:stearoyl-CoA desaturase (Delta-9 desaturase)